MTETPAPDSSTAARAQRNDLPYRRAERGRSGCCGPLYGPLRAGVRVYILAVRLAVETRGAGRPIVCLPWFSLDRSVMAAALEPAVADLAGWQRIYVDPPGCGQSPPGPADSDGVVEVLADFLDREIGSTRPLLAGCSYGGYLAASLARRHPQRIAGLLLVCHGNQDQGRGS